MCPHRNINELLTFQGCRGPISRSSRALRDPFQSLRNAAESLLLRAAEVPLTRVTGQGATHIVKSFDPREYPELAANEYFCTQAARAAGIAAPDVRLSRNRRILVIERFDRTPQGMYLGCEDFCVLNALRAHGRYEGSYELIAKRIGQFISAEEQAQAIEQLFATVALCCAIENGDAHLKNFAVLYENAQSAVHLAPAYDLVSTTIYRACHGAHAGGTKAFPERNRLIAFGRQACGLSSARVTTCLATD